MTELREEPVIPGGLDALVARAAGHYRRRGSIVRDLLEEAGRIEAREPEHANLSDARLRDRLAESRERFRRRPDPGDEALDAALALVREAGRRTLGLHARSVQLAGALALHRGYLAELATGEGKTLSAALAATLAAWSGRPCHIVTANDYLARRDAGWMGPLYRFCGIDAGFVGQEQEPPERRAAYARAVTYATGKELVADFLRDRLRLGRLQHFEARRVPGLVRDDLVARRGPVMRGLHTAIVDEADHILIDESVTPVIISSPHPNEVFQAACAEARGLAERLEPRGDFTIDASYRAVELTPEGKRRVDEMAAGMPGLWKAARRSRELVVQALTARHLYENGKQYVVQDGKLVIVDEFTGRLMPQRTWREGLHQAIEAKEGLPMSDLSETSMRLSFQRFFRFFRKLSGMTGTAREAADEFWQIYRLGVVCIPPHRPVIRVHESPRFFAREEDKWTAVVESIRENHGTGRPVLVGVRSVGRSERLSGLLTAAGLPHNVLNAVRHAEEAQIVTEAGGEGRITIATNMAGRGTDIKLGKGLAERGGLHILATEFHEAGRVDRQLYGRSGRQGDPGTAVTFASLEDELVLRYAPASVRRQAALMLAAGAPAAGRFSRLLFRQAQRTAERRAFKQRREVLRMDNWLEESLAFAQGAVGG